MGLSSNIIWHQTSLEGLKAILQTQCFICSYSLETIKWRQSELTVAFPMISFCDLPISDMGEYLRDNKTNELTGRYGCCTIGLSLEWAKRYGMNIVWYHDSQSSFLRRTLPQKSELLKSLKSKIHTNRWMLLSRCKPYTGALETKGFVDYRFYDEKETRYVPLPKELDDMGIEKVLTKEEYYNYKKSRIPFSYDKQKGDSLIPKIILPFRIADVRYILFANDDDKSEIEGLIKSRNNNIIYTSYKRIVEEIIGMEHGVRTK